jgi:hypothetical protein
MNRTNLLSRIAIAPNICFGGASQFCIYSAVPAQKRFVVRPGVRSLKNASCKTEMLPVLVSPVYGDIVSGFP